MPRLFAGTSGWAYPSWKPGFYPEKLARAKFLQHYAQRLNTVEVNYTFRHRLTEKTAQNWMATTPANFQFAFKAHQAITHFRQLRDVAQLTADFLASVNGFAVAKKLGPILFQTSPHLKCDLQLLRDFLAPLPRGGRFAVEFRNAGWFQEEVYAALRERNVALCLAESEKLEAPRVTTADFVYLRLRREPYDDASRAGIAGQCRQLLSSGDVYAYFKHEDDPSGALHAEELLAACR